MLPLVRSCRAKNAPKLSSINLKYRICKMKQYLIYILMIKNLNILAILRTFLNLTKKELWKTLHQQKQQSEVLYNKGFLKNFVNFTGKHPCQSLFWNKFITTLLKKRLWHRCFSVKFANFLRTSFLYNTSERLLLTSSKLPQLLLLNFLAKFLTERKYLMNTLIFLKRKFLQMNL